ncbi:hypothetical protein [Thalassospira sp.]|uniref:hypothetical protein n=1 Tax=Thalassospira sp. TaxID=1912094 RepID=UPI000C68275F|nr:hypothetical protein [Thalassospira sp.]MBC08290.1 hypothetical protein [Thalassospira sp.]|tara:strand:+ start:1167 stop:2174 length:1008 start_codon:yes stop_codon:yes gene_type:complete
MKVNNISTVTLPGNQITGAVRLASQATATGLYMSSSGPNKAAKSAGHPFVTTLASIALDVQKALAPQRAPIFQMLPSTTTWDINFSNSKGAVTYTSSNGGFNNVFVAAVASDGTLTPEFSYEVEDGNSPTFLRNTSTNPAKQIYISAILSGYNLAIIGLQEQDGKQVPGVSGLIGTSEAPVSVGRVCGDFSQGLPQTVSLFYKTDERVGPLTPGMAFRGRLSFATFDTKNNKLGTPVSLLDGSEIADFDLAATGDCYCLLISLSNGMPLLATFDATGKLTGGPDQLAGPWNSVGHWIGSPTLIPDPTAKSPAFRFAFVEHDTQGPINIHTGQCGT